MISRQEILDFASELKLAPQVVEKDYVLGWLLAGIHHHSAFAKAWIFKGGTCLKKCFFETYRFSEDLDFTVVDPGQIHEEFLNGNFGEVITWVNEQTGIEFPPENMGFELYTNVENREAAEGKVAYRGPLQLRGSLPRIRLDLTQNEKVVCTPVVREVNHPYSDKPSPAFQIQCYSFEEVVAEKLRALSDRLRPRDLYDVIHLYRHDPMHTDRGLVAKALREKCAFKGLPVPTLELLSKHPSRKELAEEWDNMLRHQLPSLPPMEQFWNELPQVFQWLETEKPIPAPMRAHPTPKGTPALNISWRPPVMIQSWGGRPIEIIRYAAANRLLVDLRYDNKSRWIEPYSLRQTQNGHLLLMAVKHHSGEPRAYRVDRIQGATVTDTPFSPRYLIELSASGYPTAPPLGRTTTTR